MRFCYQKLGQGVLGFGAFFFLRTIFASTIIELLIMFIKYKNTFIKYSNTLATWWEEPTHWNRPWCWERLKAGRKGHDREWDGWTTSPNQWTWVWATLGVGDGQGSGASCSPWGRRVRHDNRTTKYKTSMLYWWFHMPSPSSSWHPWGKCYDCFTDEKTEICRVKWLTASEGKMWDLPSSFWLHSLCSEPLGLL